jgi:hypothetical protein
VTRLGEFSPVVWLFILKITEVDHVFCLLYQKFTLRIIILTKWVGLLSGRIIQKLIWSPWIHSWLGKSWWLNCGWQTKRCDHPAFSSKPTLTARIVANMSKPVAIRQLEGLDIFEYFLSIFLTKLWISNERNFAQQYMVLIAWLRLIGLFSNKGSSVRIPPTCKAFRALYVQYNPVNCNLICIVSVYIYERKKNSSFLRLEKLLLLLEVWWLKPSYSDQKIVRSNPRQCARC